MELGKGYWECTRGCRRTIKFGKENSFSDRAWKEEEAG